jgi:glycosyltransferase involved in cell wall biosynthesis
MVKLSIGLPVYNGEEYLSEALDSLLSQTYRDFELVISDNASVDRTDEICRAYAAKDKRIKYFRCDQNMGAAPNFNRVFELSSAPLFKWAAADDLHAPTYLERCMEVMERDPSVVLCHSYVTLVDENARPLRFDEQQGCFIDGFDEPVMRMDRTHIAESGEPEDRFRDLLVHMKWCFESFGIIRREALLKTPLHKSYYGADKIFLAALALQGRYHQVPEPLFLRRLHAGCTYAKSPEELADHINTDNAWNIPHFMMFKDYLKIAATADDLSLLQRGHCLLSIIRLTLRPNVWRGFLVPGPENYLGISFGKAAQSR